MDEVIKIIKIETGGSEQTVKGLKEEISSLRDALLNAEKGSEEYKNILDQLIEDQKRLTDVMNAGVKEAKAAEGSYNALVNQMAALKKVWRETTDEASKKALGKQIKELNDKLKEADASIGNYQRNVGNYTQSVTAAFGSMGGAAKGMIGPINGVKQAFNALAAHPIVAVLTALAALLINGIAKGFKNSEEAANKTKVAFAALQGIADAVNKAFEKVALWLANVTEKAVALIEKLGWLSPELKKSMEDRKKIAEDEIKLDDKRRDNIRKNANLEKEAAELRAKAADKDKYTAQERLAFLEQAEQKELEISNNEVESLKLEWDIAKAKLEISKDNAELKDAEAEAEAKYVAAKTAHAQKLQSSRKAISRTRQEMVRDARQAEQALLNLQKDLIQQEYDLAVDGSEDQLRLAKELASKDLEIKQNELKEKIKSQKDYNKALELLMKQHNKDIEKLEYEHENKRIERMEQKLDLDAEEIFDAVEKAAKKLDNAEKILDEKKKQLETIKDKTSQEYTELEMDIRKRQITVKLLEDEYYETVATRNEQEARLIFESTIPLSKAYRNMFHIAQENLEKIHSANTESEAAFELRKKAMKKQVNEYFSLFVDAARAEEEISRKLLDVQSIYDQTIGGKWQTWYQKLFKHYALWDLTNSVESELSKSQLELESYISDVNSKLVHYVVQNSETMSESFMISLKAFIRSLSGEDAQIERSRWEKIFGVESLDDVTSAIFAKVTEVPEHFEQLKHRLVIERLFPVELMDEYLQALSSMTNTEAELLRIRYQHWEDLAKGIADLSKGISDIYAINLENQKKKLEKEGKYTEQERKNLEQRYKTVQAMQIAEATINTISGAVAAFMKCQELGQPWGAILGAVQAAAVTAAGIAQIMKIKQTNPYSDNSSSLSGGDMMSATVQPTVTDFEPSYSQNLTGRSDTEYLNELFGKTNLWVSVVDVNDAQERGRVRISESSF